VTKKSAYIKTLIITSAIFVESFFLTKAFISYFETEGYFSLNPASLSTICLLMLALTYTVSISSPAWNEWSQFAIVPLPITIGVYLNLFKLEPTNALVFSAVLFLVLSFFIEKSINLEQMLAKNIPSVFLRPAIKGLLLGISIVAACIVILNPRDSAQEITDTVEQATTNKVTEILRNKLGGQNSSISGLLDYTSLEQNIGDEITTQVKKAIEPYKQIINVLMAVFVFLAMQGINTIVYLIYSITVGAVFFAAEKTGLMRKESTQIDKETLKF